MRLAAIFVNYKTSELTLRAVGALLEALKDLGKCHTYVVDNDSGDGSYERMRDAVEKAGWTDRVSVLAAPRNGGYGYGINYAVRAALAQPELPDYFYVINTDAFAGADSLEKLLGFMDAHPDAGLSGSRIDGEDGHEQGAAFRFHSVWSEFERAVSFGPVSRALRNHIVSIPSPPADLEVDWLPGTSMMIRRSVFEAGVYFDEGFFLYFEEVDFARELRQAGFRAYYVANAPITHIGSVSTGLGDRTRRLPDYWFDSRHRYFVKHHGPGYAAACDAAWVVGYPIYLLKRAVLGQKDPVRKHFMRDLMRASLRNLAQNRPRTSSA